MNILQTYDYQEEIAKEDKDRIKIIRQLREQFSIMTIGILAQLSDVEDWHMDPFRETIQFHPVNYTFQSTSFLHPEPETIQ